MAAQLQAQGSLKVLGITVVSGNQWLKQGVSDALKSVERLGVENQIGVYAGANYALSHDFATIEAEQKQFPGGDGYLGAWNTPEPKSDSDLIAPPDGFATHTKVQSRSAVDFIVDSVKQYPGEVTILAIGPRRVLFKGEGMAKAICLPPRVPRSSCRGNVPAPICPAAIRRARPMLAWPKPSALPRRSGLWSCTPPFCISADVARPPCLGKVRRRRRQR
jgi:hypothetical protein